MKIHLVAAALFAAGVVMSATLTTPASAQTHWQRSLADFETAKRISEERLATFQTLDFDVYSNQKWDRVKESHSEDIVVYWPDGHSTRGIEKHIEDMKFLFTYAPDARIKQHPIRIADGDWTSVVGVFEGTFTKPMVLPDGTVIQPTGRAFKFNMVTVGHWNSAGVMTEEYLFWDNKAFMDQIMGK
ncbi:TPA: ester cyclase [Pseudomonas aeruginosa]|nr:ester cyclase [Pseudomonas aeruginosa]HEH8432079.1 ester cyclase [Pseudomonas aeruginosa]HEH8533630.1 ester cyclase [Pseudomonas aeruginosa]HEH8759657.1 ester cyclase [Pseudomonas aeruginosa]